MTIDHKPVTVSLCIAIVIVIGVRLTFLVVAYRQYSFGHHATPRFLPCFAAAAGVSKYL
jgi:hypothetical protein